MVWAARQGKNLTALTPSQTFVLLGPKNTTFWTPGGLRGKKPNSHRKREGILLHLLPRGERGELTVGKRGWPASPKKIAGRGRSSKKPVTTRGVGGGWISTYTKKWFVSLGEEKNYPVTPTLSGR